MANKDVPSYAICPEPDCEQVLKRFVKVWIWADVHEEQFNKTALRKKGLEVHYVERQEIDKWVCPKHGFPHRKLMEEQSK